MVALSDMSFIKKQQTWVDKRGKTRQIPMKVICPGLSRTGTSSMRVALWELGYEAYHSWSLFENPPDSILWQEAMKAKFEGKGRLYQKADFDSILFNSDAITDVPGGLFAEELIDAYPQAKVVMTTRDIDSWYAANEPLVSKPSLKAFRYSSCLSTIVPFTHPPLLVLILGYLDRAAGLYLPTCNLTIKHAYGTDFAANGKAIYRQHYSRVRQKMLDAGRGAEYLEFSVKEGWEPLCGFLGREVPRDEEGKVKPFPKVNDRATFGQTFEPYFEALFRQIFWRAVMGLGAVVVFVGAWLWTRENV